MTIDGTAPPLTGFRVLDCTDELGVNATKLLADLGAEVIRLEAPAGDPMRSFPPFADQERSISLYYAHFNAGKRAITLDLDRPESLDYLRLLVARCHAIVESGAVRDLLSSRAGVAWLTDARPDLVLVSITPFGLSGSNAEHAGGDLIVAAQSGLLWLNGRPDGTPYRPGGEQAAHMASLLAANATLLGLFQQQRGGQGCRLEIPATFAASLATLQTANANYATWHRRIPARRGMSAPFTRHIFQAADGWVALTALPGQWERLVCLLRDHDAVSDLDDPAYLDAGHRVEQAEHINEVIEDFTRRYPKRYVFETAQRAGVAATPVNLVPELAADPFLERRGYVRELFHSELGRLLPHPGPPVRMAGRDVGARRAAPAHGDDNEAIWVREMGIERDIYEAMRRTGVL
jgi:benzylsuccinate CoA-transferase BbsE subunit